MKLDNFFQTPILIIEKPEWIEDINFIADEYIKKEIKLNLPNILNYNIEKYGKENIEKIKDFATTYHSTTLIDEVRLKIFKSFVKETSLKFLETQGFNLSNHSLKFTELWVQEFTKNGGCYHDTHIHYNNHISGFYFLKCSARTSFPVFGDPRPGALMTKLPKKNINNITYANDNIHLIPNNGTMIFFPSYLPHHFPVDFGLDDFRFIHFNLQAIDKGLYNDLE